MYAALVRLSDSWRGVRIGGFEPRQPQALREDQERACRAELDRHGAKYRKASRQSFRH